MIEDVACAIIATCALVMAETVIGVIVFNVIEIFSNKD